MTDKKTVYDFKLKKADGTEQSLADFKGIPLLIVNTASQCGFTPQYEGLQALYKEFGSGDKLNVLACPCDQFGGQEPGNDEEIKNFCKLKYDVSFPIFKKLNVNGDNADPLWQFLKEQQRGILGTTSIKWNFTKFLIDHEGNVVARYSPTDKPESIKKDIEKLVAAAKPKDDAAAASSAPAATS